MESKCFNRRDVIKSGLGLLGGSLIPFEINLFSEVSNLINAESSYSFVKHGQLGLTKDIVWCIMHASNKENLNNKILKLRSDLNYRTELKYSKNDKYKIDFGKAIIDLVYKGDWLEFDLLKLELDQNSISLSDSKDFNEKSLNIYKSFDLKLDKLIALECKEDYSFGATTDLNNLTVSLCKMDHKFVNVKENNLIQINDFISGIIYSNMNPTKTQSWVKVELNNYFNDAFKCEEIKTDMVLGKNINIKFVKN